MKKDLAIIGGGPGGYTAAAKAAKAGLSVVLFEKRDLGGTCLNRGCIPMKALLHASETYAAMRSAEAIGLRAENVSYDFAAIHARKAEVVAKLRAGVAQLMKSGKVEVVQGEARVEGPGRVRCNGEDWEAENIIVAVGAQPACPPIPGGDLPGVVTSDAILEGEGVDTDALVIIGGGVIGLECAAFYAPMGARVTILEAREQLLPGMDREIAQRLAMQLKKSGVAAHTSAMVQKIEQTDAGLRVTWLDKKGAEQTAEAGRVLMATGRRAATEGLFAPGAEPETQRGAVCADEAGRTSVPGLWAIGDCKAGTIQLAHVASAQAENAVAAILGQEPPVDMATVPACVYTSPEVASVGLTEEAAKAAGIAVKGLKTPTGANGKSVISGGEGGYAKLVVAQEDGRVLGAQLVCPRATDLIAELALAVERGCTAEDLVRVIHPHPTVSEIVRETAALF